MDKEGRKDLKSFLGKTQKIGYDFVPMLSRCCLCVSVAKKA
jgi:hypothetical protein